MFAAIEERVILAGMLVALAGSVAWHIYDKGEVHGAVKCVAEGKANVAKNDEKVGKQEAAAATDSKKIGETYANATAPPVTDAPKFVCERPSPAKPRKVLPATGPGPAADAAPTPRADDQGQPAVWDSTPVVTAGRNGDAQINGLIDYIEKDCRAPKNY